MKIAIIADSQIKPGVDLSYLSHIGQYLADKRPDVVVHIGDAFDFPSLSSYDKGKLAFEGRRLKEDIEVGKKGMKMLLQPIKDMQEKQRQNKKKQYTPRLVFCTGNHEERYNKLAQTMPELAGFVGIETLGLEDDGWEVHEFLKPVEVGGICFVHYLANQMTGKAFGGTAMNQLKTVGKSFVVGHSQKLDVAIRSTLDNRMQIGIINGAAYPFHEDYKGYQGGNTHFRGITMLNEVEDGFGLPSFVSLDYLAKKYL